MVKKIWLGTALILVVLTISFYMLLPEKVRIDFEKTRTIFKVYEDGKFVISGIEYVRLFDGTTLMRANNRIINYTILNGTTIAERISSYKDEIIIEDLYQFNNNVTNAENVPVSHKVCFTNAKDKIFEYLISNIEYDGETKEITSPFSFGKNMELTFQNGYYRAKVYQNKIASDKIIIRYRIESDYDCFDVRLFDPPTDFQENMKACWNWDGDATDDYGSYDGTLESAPTNVEPYGWLGEGSGAYHYQGAESIAVGGVDKNFNFGLNGSVLFCYNGTDNALGQFIFGNDDTGARGYNIHIAEPGGELRYADEGGGSFTGTTNIADGTINCHVVTHRTDTITTKIYTNGIFNASDTSSNPPDVSPQTYFGKRGLDNSFLDGWIGISAFWENKTLSDAEITELHANLVAGAICPTLVIAVDETPPIVNTSINNTLPNINQVVNISANITDETGLSFCQVIENQTGSKVYYNFSLSGTTGKCSQDITISVSRGNVINLTIRANDTSNNWKTNDTIITVVDVIAPDITILSPANNSVHTVDYVDLNWTSDENVNWCAYSLDDLINNTKICNLPENFLDLTEGFILVANQGFLAQSFNTTKNTTLDILSMFVHKPANRVNSTITLRSGGLILAEGFLNETIDPNRWINISLNQSINIIAGTRYWINTTGAFTDYWLWMRVDSDYENGTSESESGVGAADLSIKLYSNKTIATNITLTSLSEGSHNVTIWANDSLGNMGQTDFTYFDVDGTPPIVNTSINNTSPKINEVINISANITDGVGLSFCQVIENQTGSIVYTNYSLSGTSDKCSKAITISVSRGNVINFTIRANDTSNHFTTNDTIITIANTVPSFSSASISPNNGRTDQSLTGSTSGYSDADSDSESGSTYKWYKNDIVIGGETTTSLASSNFVRGDAIIFEAKPKDGFDFGSPVNSSASTIVDTVASVSIGINNTSPKINEVINVSSNTTDADDLSFCLIKTNQSGAFTKNTFALSGTSGFCSDPITMNVGRGNVVNFTIEINDSVGGIIYQNSTKVTVADTSGSISIGINATSIRINYVVNVSGNITEPDGDIVYGWVVENQTGTNVNYTFALSGYNANFSQAITISATRGDVINFTVFYNDTAGTQFQNSTKFTVVNTNPTQPNMINTSGLYYNTNQTFNITPSTDADSDTLTYFWFLNSSIDSHPNLVAYGVTVTNWTTNVTDSAVYYLFVNVSDGIVNVSGDIFSWTFDNIAPVVNTSINNTAPRINNIVNISANITDETGLSFCQVIENQTGSNTITNYVISGTDDKCSKAITVTVNRGNVINFTIRANDTSNNLRTNDTIITVTDTAGSIAIGLNVTAIRFGDVVNVSGNITEPDGDIAFGWVVDNRTGVNINTTFALSGYNANFSKAMRISTTRGNVINFSVFYNDTAGTQYQNSTKLTVSDTTASVSIGINNSAPKINDVVNVSSNVTDADGLSWCLIKTNQTGVFTNNTFALSGTSGFCSDNISISVGKGNVINFTIEVNDTTGLTIYQNSTKVTVANAPPPIPTILYPTIDLYTHKIVNVSLNVTFPADADGDSVTINYYINGKINTSGVTGNTTFNASEGYYILNVSLFDGTDSSTSNATVNFTTVEGFNYTYSLNTCYNYTWSSLGDCFSPNWTKAWDQINWSDNATIRSGNFTWNFTDENVTNFQNWLFNFTNNDFAGITIKISLNITNTSRWQLFYGGTNLTKTSETTWFTLSANETKFLNLSMYFYNLTERYVNWSLYKSNVYWGFNFTITEA